MTLLFCCSGLWQTPLAWPCCHEFDEFTLFASLNRHFKGWFRIVESALFHFRITKNALQRGAEKTFAKTLHFTPQNR